VISVTLKAPMKLKQEQTFKSLSFVLSFINHSHPNSMFGTRSRKLSQLPISQQ